MMIVRHKVRDYGQWRPIYNQHPEMQKEAGLINPRVYHSADSNKSEIVVVFDTEDTKKAKAFAASPDPQRSNDGGWCARYPYDLFSRINQLNRRVSDWLRASSILKVALYVMKQQVMTLIPWLIGLCRYLRGGIFRQPVVHVLSDQTRAAPAEAGLDHVKEIEIAAADGVTLVAWYASARNDKPTILYFHGNAANAANRAPEIELIQEHGFGVLYLNNRGYGGSGGRPTEEDNVADAISAAYDYLIGLGVPGRQDRRLRRVRSDRARRCGSRLQDRWRGSCWKRR